MTTIYVARVLNTSRMPQGVKAGDWLPVACMTKLHPLGTIAHRVAIGLADFQGPGKEPAKSPNHPDNTWLPFNTWSDELEAFEVYQIRYEPTNFGWAKRPLSRDDAWELAS